MRGCVAGNSPHRGSESPSRNAVQPRTVSSPLPRNYKTWSMPETLTPSMTDTSGSEASASSLSISLSNEKETPAATPVRSALRRSMIDRRNTLTKLEVDFLDNLVVTGREHELESARGVLEDRNLFFDIPDTTEQNQELKVFSSSPETVKKQGQSARSPGRRAKIPPCRRSSMVHQSLWRAHESGLSANPKHSRRRSVVPPKKIARRFSKASVLVRQDSKHRNKNALPDQGCFDCEDRSSTQNMPSPATVRRMLRARRASAGTYDGQGFELEESDMNCSFFSEESAQVTPASNETKKSIRRSSITNDDGMDLMSVVPISKRRQSKCDFELDLCKLHQDDEAMEQDERETMSHGDGYEDSWDGDCGSEDGKDGQCGDRSDTIAWQVLENDAIPFLILGTSADDLEAMPHVLSPPLMESLHFFFPYSICESNFWMKFSMVRDGMSLYKLLQSVRGSKYTLLAIETVDGEVFGAFTGASWKKTRGWFGSGESFLWRMRGNRRIMCDSVIDQARIESELEVFNWTGENDMIQMCTSDKLALGGGEIQQYGNAAHDPDSAMHGGSFGLAVDENLLWGSSSQCATFSNPPLCKSGTTFEISNLEVWTLTPFMKEEDALKAEMRLLFFEN